MLKRITGITVAVCTLFISASFLCREKKVEINGQITSTRSHCGGMRPTEEMEKELRTPKPLSGKTIYFREGKENDWKKPIVATATSDHAGNFSVKLKPGIYCIVDESKKDDKYYNELLKTYTIGTENYDPIDKSCLDELMLRGDKIIEVKKEGNIEFMINYHQNCSYNNIPCANYTGPLPP